MMTFAGGSTEYHSRNRTEAAKEINGDNWDDDFEFHGAEETQPQQNTSDATQATSHRVNNHEQEESWDDAYVDDDEPSEAPQRAPKMTADDEDVEDWDSSDNEVEPTQDITPEFGGGGFEEEDKTVTARSTTSGRTRVPPPQLPLPLPVPAPFSQHSQMHSILPSTATSPTLSTFSIPLSSHRDHSVYSQEPLLRTPSTSAPHLTIMRSYPHAAGSTPPRKGRRLKKKSRPPEADIFELEDRDSEALPPPAPLSYASSSHLQPPVTPPDLPSSSSQQQPPALPPQTSPSLLSRIGSFKRWAKRSIGPEDPSYTGWRSSRTSVGPSETKILPNGHISKSSTGPEDILLEVVRSVSPTPAPLTKTRTRGASASGLKSGWFFRNGGAARNEEAPTPLAAAIAPSAVPLVSPGSPPKKVPLSPMKRRATRGKTPEPKGEDIQESRDENVKEGRERKESMTPTPRKSKGKLVPILKSPMKMTRPPSRDGAPLSRGISESPLPNSRPVSMQVDNPRPMLFLFPKHAASVGRHSGAPVASIVGMPHDRDKYGEVEKGNEKDKDKAKEGGMRGLMQGVRRLSQVGGHKRTKSTGIGDKPEAAQSISNGLLPPIELDSPVTSSTIFARRGSVPWADYMLPSPSTDQPAYALPPAQLSPDLPSMERYSFSTNASTSSSHGSPASSPARRPSTSPVTRPKPSRADTSPPSAILPSTMKQLASSSPTLSRQPSPSSHRPGSSASQRRPGSSSSMSSPPVSSQAASFARPRTPIRNSITNPIIISQTQSARPRTPVRTTSTTSVTMPGEPSKQLPQPQAQSHSQQSQAQVTSVSTTASTSMPATYSASLGRTALPPQPPVPAGLRRNSFGDLKINTLSEHIPSLSTLGEHKALGERKMSGDNKALGERKTSGEHRSLEERKASTNTLGELKIPARISRAQQGLRRDLGMVREFAGCVEQLKRLQTTYMKLVEELCTAYEAYPLSRVPSRSASQIGFTKKGITTNPNTSTHSIQQHTPAQQAQPLPLSLNSPTKSRSFSRTSNDLNRELARLEQDYGIWWECAELLVELGGGTTTANASLASASNPNLLMRSSSSASALNIQAQAEESMPRASNHTPSMSDPGSIFESAVVNGKSLDPPRASPPNSMQWRASTGRHDLSARQLRLLKDMLNTPDPATLADTAATYDSSCPPSAFPHPGGSAAGQLWASWNPSVVTLPSEESSADLDVCADADADPVTVEQKEKENGKAKKHRLSKLGMLGLRDLLRGLKRTAVAEGRLPQRSDSSLSSNGDDDHYNRRRSPWHQHEAHHVHDVPEHASARIIPPKSPRRPSLASIFRLGYKGAKSNAAAVKAKDEVIPNQNRSPSMEDDTPNSPGLDGYGDWDRMSRSDLDLAAVGTGMATVRGRKMAKSPTSFSANLHPYAPQGATTPKRTTPSAASQTSLWESPLVSQPRGPVSTTLDTDNAHAQRLKGILTSRPNNSNSKQRTSSWSQAHPSLPRSPSRTGKSAMSGTVRSAPPTDISPPDPKLSLTPENIKPLLEYAKEVSTRLTDCISEVQTLLGVGGSGTGTT